MKMSRNNARAGPANPQLQRTLVETVRAITPDASYASQITSLISELGLIEEDARTVFSTLTLTDDDVTKMQEVTRYEGFNPRVILKILLNKWKASVVHHQTRAAEEVSMTIQVGDEEREIRFSEI